MGLGQPAHDSLTLALQRWDLVKSIEKSKDFVKLYPLSDNNFTSTYHRQNQLFSKDVYTVFFNYTNCVAGVCKQLTIITKVGR